MCGRGRELGSRGNGVEQAIERASEEGWKGELVSCGSDVLRQRGACGFCGMAGNATEGSEWRTCIDGVGGEGREGR